MPHDGPSINILTILFYLLGLWGDVVTLTKVVTVPVQRKCYPGDNPARASRALRMAIEPLPTLLETAERYLNQYLEGLGAYVYINQYYLDNTCRLREPHTLAGIQINLYKPSLATGRRTRAGGAGNSLQ